MLIVDDHAIVRTGLAGMLAETDDFLVVGQAADGQEALRQINSLRPDVVLMDLRMPRMDGATCIAELRARGDATPILVLTTYDADTDILLAIESGANGYLLKDASRDELISAIRATHAGEAWLTPSVASRVMMRIHTPQPVLLSERELEVLQAVASGASNKEIAAVLHVSQATIKTHLIHIFRKLDVTSRTAAVTAALERGLISMP